VYQPSITGSGPDGAVRLDEVAEWDGGRWHLAPLVDG
jgi:hypothetical protein